MSNKGTPRRHPRIIDGTTVWLCKGCGSWKVPAGFFKDSRAKNCLSSECRSCASARAKEYSKTPHAKARASISRNKYAKSAQGKKRLASPKHQVKIMAQRAVERSVINGSMVRGCCVVCGAVDDVHGHHADYSEPLVVTWLCRPHHNEEHARLLRQQGETICHG